MADEMRMIRHFSRDRRIDSARGRRRSSGLPFIGESVAPWLSASIVLGAVNATIVVRGQHLEALDQVVLLMGLCGTLCAAGLVSTRSHRDVRATLLVERSRPAAEELVGPTKANTVTYVDGMVMWTEAMLELIDHACSVGDPGSSEHVELMAAAADTRELHDLLCAKASEDLTLNDQAQMHALGSLWETGQMRAERLAAELDPTWHRRWRGRSVVARGLRHGEGRPEPLRLPYGA